MIDDLYAISDQLTSKTLGRRLVLLEETGSTNEVARRLGRGAVEEGAVVIADAQTAGRGRLGRGWSSPPGAGLYLSAVMRPAIAPHRAPLCAFAAALAVHDAVSDALRTLDAEAQIEAVGLKWPNDVVARIAPPPEGPRKLAGILAELSIAGDRIEQLVVGIGINLNAVELPAELASRATSLGAIARATRPCDRARLAARVIEGLERWIDLLVSDGAAPVMVAWRARAFGLGAPVRVDRGAEMPPLEGLLERVDDEGALWVRPAGAPAGSASMRVLTGDVELVSQAAALR